METKEKPTLYYIHANSTNQLECIKALEEKGGQNRDKLDGTCDLPCLYYIDEVNVIAAVSPNDTFGKFIMCYGEKLYLQEKQKVLKWEDVVSVNKGLYFITQEMDEDKETYSTVSYWPTRQQAESAKAAAMISQIREQGKDIYGEIVPSHEESFSICLFIEKNVKEYKPYFSFFEGGILRFKTEEQAKLFLENNQELVQEYLKTF